MALKYVRRYGSFFLFLAPALLFYITFLVAPILQGMYYSLTNWRFMVPDFEFVGLANFITIFQNDQDFIHSIFFTFRLVIVLVIIQNILALGLALMINASERKFHSFFRTTFFMPHMISTIIATFIFSFIFSNVLLEFSQSASFLAFLDQPWLGNPDFAFWSLVIVHLWNGVPLMMIIYLAGLSGVPVHLKESALIDGANSFQIFKDITLPMIMPALTICVFLTLKEAFKTFEIVYALTDGGPGKRTEVMTLNIYNEAFSSNFLYGYASAKAMMLFLFVLVISIIQIGIMKRREVEA